MVRASKVSLGILLLVLSTMQLLGGVVFDPTTGGILLALSGVGLVIPESGGIK